MKKAAFVVIFILLLSFMAGELRIHATEGPFAGLGMVVSPSTLRISGNAGEIQTETIRVSNNGSAAVTIIPEVKDVANQLDKDGHLERVFLAPGSSSFSCAQWINVKDGEFVLGPGESRNVTFSLSPPAGFSGGKSAVIFFKKRAQNEKEGAAGENTTVVQMQVGALVFYEIKGTVRRTGEFRRLSHEAPAGKAPLKIIYEFENSGNADILLSGTFYITDKNKAVVGKGALVPMRTFPGDKGSVETEWRGNLAPGKYQLVITLNQDPEGPAPFVREFDLAVK